MMRTFWNCRLLLVSSPIRSNRDHFLQADLSLPIGPTWINSGLPTPESDHSLPTTTFLETYPRLGRSRNAKRSSANSLEKTNRSKLVEHEQTFILDVPPCCDRHIVMLGR